MTSSNSETEGAGEPSSAAGNAARRAPVPQRQASPTGRAPLIGTINLASCEGAAPRESKT